MNKADAGSALAFSLSEDLERIATCAERAVALMRTNLGPQGFFAATPGAEARERGYDRVFGRDAAICAIAAAHCGDAELIAGAESSLLTLGAHQAANGQIPKYVDTAKNSADFWYLGCIDATLWWLIAIAHLAQRAPGLERRLRRRIGRALDWLSCQEHQQIFLLQQNEASDWADIMPRSGYVLYTNALWYEVKRRFALDHAEATKHHFNHLFNPFQRDLPEYHRARLLQHYARRGRRDPSLYLSFVNLAVVGGRRTRVARLFRESGILNCFPSVREGERYLRSGQPRPPMLLDAEYVNSLLAPGRRKMPQVARVGRPVTGNPA